MIEIAAEWIGKALGLLKNLPTSFAGEYSDLLLLGLAVVGSFLLIKTIIKGSLKAVYWIALIMGVLFWIVIMIGGQNGI